MGIIEEVHKLNRKSRVKYRIEALMEFKSDISSWASIDEKEMKYILSLVKDLNAFIDYLKEKNHEN